MVFCNVFDGCPLNGNLKNQQHFRIKFANFALQILSHNKKNEEKKKSWCFRKKSMRLRCLIYRRASVMGCKHE